MLKIIFCRIEPCNEFNCIFALALRKTHLWKGARVVEEARLESVYTSKAYHGFESRPFR